MYQINYKKLLSSKKNKHLLLYIFQRKYYIVKNPGLLKLVQRKKI